VRLGATVRPGGIRKDPRVGDWSGRIKSNIRSESTLVHAVINVIVDPIVHLLNLFLQLGREEVNRSILFLDLVVKCLIEHANDLAAFVAHNLAGLLIVQRRHRKAPVIVWILLEVDVADMREVLMYRIRCRQISGDRFALFSKPPSCNGSSAPIEHRFQLPRQCTA
jgi:hypothetical protein